MLSWIEHEKSFIISGPGLYVQITIFTPVLSEFHLEFYGHLVTDKVVSSKLVYLLTSFPRQAQ